MTLKVKVYNQKNEVVGERELSERVFGLVPDAGFVHHVYTALAEAQRRGTASTKTRATISGGGRKPWPQKGTGRARQGSIRAPQWRHGAVAHGPKPRDYATRINRKERRKALAMALSAALREERLTVLDKLELSEIKTKRFVEVLQAFSVDRGVFVLGAPDRTVELSARNIPHVDVRLDGQLNLHDLLKGWPVFLTEEAVAKLEERLG